MTKPIELRPGVLAFAVAMERKLRKHDKERGETGWQDEDQEWLFNRLRDEIEELRNGIERRGQNPDKTIARESVDIGNFAMMLFDNATDQP